MSRHLWSKRSAFTLVELLTVLAIIGVLASLVLPAIGSVHETVRRNVCLNNVTQIARSVRAYEAAHHVLPPAGKGLDKAAFAAFLNGDVNAEYIKAGRFDPGLPGASGGLQDASPSVFLTLLPYLDNSQGYNRYNFSYEYLDKRASLNGEPLASFVDNRISNPTQPRFGNIGTATMHLPFLRCPSNPNISQRDPYKYGLTDYAATVYTDIYPGDSYSKPQRGFAPGSRVRASTAEGVLGLRVAPSSSVSDGEGTFMFIEDAGRADGLVGWNTLATADRISPTCVLNNGEFGYGCAPAIGDANARHYSVHRWADSNAAGIGISGQSVANDGEIPKGYINNSRTNPETWSEHNRGPNQEAFSFHRGGVNVVSYGGTGNFLSDAIDSITLRFLITKDEGQDPPTKPFE